MPVNTGRIGPGGPFLSPQRGDSTTAPFIPDEDNRPRLVAAALLLPGLWFNSAIMPEGPKPPIPEEITQPAKPITRQDREQYPNLVLRQVTVPFAIEDLGQARKQLNWEFYQPPNLVINSVAPALQLPFQNLDWRLRNVWDTTNPHIWFNSVILPEGPKPAFNAEVPQQTNPVLLTAESYPNFLPLRTQVVQPFLPEELPWASRGIKSQPENQQSRAILEVFPPPFSNEDLGALRAASKGTQDQHQNLIIRAAPPVVLPFQDFDWRLPNRSWEPTNPHTWFNSAIMPNPDAPSISPPFIPYEWANAKAKLGIREAAEQSRLVLEVPPVTKPFVPFEWPVQRLRLRPTDQTDQFPLVNMPATQAETRQALLYTVRKSAPARFQDSVPSRLVLEVAPVTTPFVPRDWSMPRRILRPMDQADVYPLGSMPAEQALQREALLFQIKRQIPRQFQESSPSRVILEVPQFPFFGQTTPNAPLPKLGDRNWNQNLLENTLGLSIAAPFAQYEWPLSPGVRAPAVKIAEDQGWHITEVPPEPPIPVPDVGPVGDGGRSPHHGFSLSDWKKKRKPLKDLEDDIERLYKEITSPPLARQAEKIVKPFVPPKLRDEIKPKNVEWDRVVESIRTIERLHALYEQEIRDDDDDIEDLLTLL